VWAFGDKLGADVLPESDGSSKLEWIDRLEVTNREEGIHEAL
jgi:hypothetical protein